MQEIAGLHLQLQLRLCVAVKPEEFFKQYLSQDGKLAQHFVQTIVVFPPIFAMGMTVVLIDWCSPKLRNEGIEQIGQMIAVDGSGISEAVFRTRPIVYPPRSL